MCGVCVCVKGFGNWKSYSNWPQNIVKISGCPVEVPVTQPFECVCVWVCVLKKNKNVGKKLAKPGQFCRGEYWVGVQTSMSSRRVCELIAARLRKAIMLTGPCPLQ